MCAWTQTHLRGPMDLRIKVATAKCAHGYARMLDALGLEESSLHHLKGEAFPGQQRHAQRCAPAPCDACRVAE